MNREVGDRLAGLRRRQAELNRRSYELLPRVAVGPKDVLAPLRALADDAEALCRDIDAWCELGADDFSSRALIEACGSPMREMGRQLLVFTLGGIGGACSLLGDLDGSREAGEHALALTEGRDDPERAFLSENLGKDCLALGELDRAEAAFGEALAIYEAFADPGAWVDRIGAGPGLGDEDKAALATKCGEGVARVHGLLAHVALARGDRERYGLELDRGFAEARRFGQTLLMRAIWRQRYQFALRWDVTGETLDAMNDELDHHRLPELEADEDTKLDILLLRAQGVAERESFTRAEARLKEALKKAGERPRERWTVLMAHAQLCGDRPGKTEEGIRLAEEALAIGEATGVAGFIDGARGVLINLCLEAGDPAHRGRAVAESGTLIDAKARARDADGLALALLNRARARFLDGAYEAALKDVDGALQFATARETRAQGFTARSATLQRLGRDEEALGTTIEALAMFPDRPGRTPEEPPAAWRDEMRHVEALHEGLAVICARLGRPAEAFEWAERGKARLLKRSRQLANLPAAPPSPGGLEAIRRALAADPDEPSALAMFCVGPSETALFLVTPEAEVPRVEFAPIGEPALKAMLPTADQTETSWNEALARAVPRISDALLRPLAGLREAVKTCKMLYIVPDSSLYPIPFAALTFGDGVPLIEHCALSLVPSAAALLTCRARRPIGEQTCLAVGVGETQGIRFAPQARAIADEFAGELGWGSGAEFLPEEEATPGRFLADAPKYRVIHLACHGNVLGDVMDTLTASALKMAGGLLTAKALIRPGGPWLGAELVFLNACRSAGFRMRLGSEVGGFWQAFLEAGVPSLVATLFYVDPDHAQGLAEAFYRNWLVGGMSKAQALRQAQLAMIREGVEMRHWASHILIGDHRDSRTANPDATPSASGP